jgi:hypothetical protein
LPSTATARGSVDAGQHLPHGGLAGWLVAAGQWVAADPEGGQDRLGCILGPLGDRGQGVVAGQHRGDRGGQDRDQGVAAAPPGSGVGELGEGDKQVTTLVARQRVGSVGTAGKGGDEG